MSQTSARPVFPVFLRLDGVPVLVVGAGPVAASKLDALLSAQAKVTVVAPQIHSAFRRPDITVVERSFEPADLDGQRFVVAAAPPAINRAVQTHASARGLFVNAVDDVEAASAFLGAVVRRGDVTVAISTGGSAPLKAER